MPATAAGQTLGPYVVESELGRGAHGIVYRAHRGDRPEVSVALKVVAGRGDLDHLLVEPAVLARLDHPCIVRLEDYFVRGEDLVLALEYIEGENLQALLDRGETIAPAEVRTLLVQIAGALAEAHSHNVLHRDVKPSNILVAPSGAGRRFVLTDFGIGQVAEGIQARKHTGGTFYYMAPEQLRGRPGAQSDLWALGVVAYQLLSGRMPFEGPSLTELSHQILYAAPPPLGLVESDLEAAVVRLLDKSLQERTASAEDLLRQLGHRGSSAEVVRAVQRARLPGPGLSLDRKLARGIRRRRVVQIVCALVYLLAGGLLARGLTIAGMILFARTQARPRGTRASRVRGNLGACALLGVGLLWPFFFPLMDVSPVTMFLATKKLESVLPSYSPGPVMLAILGVATVLVTLVVFFLPVIAGAVYAALRRLDRERALTALRELVDRRFEDVGLHLKYAEALFACGQHLAAAVEARLLLLQDPYHFSGNLLLANAYAALGLCDEAAAVCDCYLQVSGYCFEFSELREQCLRRLGRS
jgi:serine/threonine-protein kinase